MKNIKNFVNGSLVDGSKNFLKRSPIDGQVIAKVEEAGVKEVDAAVSAARASFDGEWGKVSLTDRVEMLYEVASEMERRFDDFVEAEVSDTGQPASLARNMNVPRGTANFRIFADVIKNIPTECFEMKSKSPDGGYSTAINYSLRYPVGVVGIICPWNVPLLLTTWKVAPALACGNSVVVKPSEETPQSAVLLGEVMKSAGIPDGVYNVVNGFGPDSAGEYLVNHSGVDAITFTGESKTGEVIMQGAAIGARPVSFEMGGKNPAIIFADCDLDAAIQGTMKSVFVNCGQVCLGTERVFVERPIYDEFVKRFKAAAESLRPGAPTDSQTSLGPLISDGQRRRVLSYYEKALAEGAEVVTGGGIPTVSDELSDGYWVEPTIWTGLPDSSSILTEEIFGPCCHISPFDDETEVLARANNTEYGLGASIWTNNLSRAHRCADGIKAGLVWVNSWYLRDLRTPFGGMGRSGIGREGGVHSIEFYTELKNVCIQL